MKRRDPLPDLRHVLDDSRPHVNGRGIPVAPASAADKRLHNRFDKAFVVVIGSELYGDAHAIARNVSAGGILVEMTYAPPLGTVVTVHFQLIHPGEAGDPDAEDEIDEIVVRAEVKHHHYLNFGGGDQEQASSRAIGMRFLEFVDLGERIPNDRLH